MSTCLRCNWVLNAPLNRERMSEMLGSMMEWLDYKGVKSTSAIKRKTLRVLKGFELISNPLGGTGGMRWFCRHCLIECMMLLVPDGLMDEFNNEFIKPYTFNSVIY